MSSVREALARRKQRGQVLVLFAGLLVLLTAMVGVAVDAGRAYLVRAELGKALDAAVLAAGVSEEGSERLGQVVADRFRVNFPRTFLGMDRRRITLGPVRLETRRDENGFVVLALSASARAELPTTFLRVLGIETLPVGNSAGAHRRLLDVVLALDQSASLGVEGLDDVQRAAKRFVQIFNPARDRVGLLSFGGSVVWGERLASEPGFDRARLEQAIDRLALSAWTAGGPALGEAYRALDEQFIDGRWRVIVYFTDGAPNTFRAAVPFRPCRDGDRLYPGSDGAIDAAGAMLAAGEADNPNPDAQYLVDGLFRPEGPSGEPDYYTGYGFDARSRQDVREAFRAEDCYDVRNRIDRLPDRDFYGARLGPVDGVSVRPVRWNPEDGWLAFRRSINGRARNELENLAALARQNHRPQGITIFTIGLDGEEENLTRRNIEWDETGEAILRRVANVPEGGRYRPDEPRGLYVPARRRQDLEPAFELVGSFILRLIE